MSINPILKEVFGKLPDGRTVYRYTLRNKSGMKVAIIDFGGAVQQLCVPDRKGRLQDVVAGYDNVIDYLEADGYQGALIGRWGNRIGKARFTLDGKVYTLYANVGENHLHGGKEGFNHKIWTVTGLEEGEEPALTLHYVSPDGEEGYPGTLDVTVTYTLKKSNALSIHYDATTDKKTILNLTNHTYFNLGGFASGSVDDHVLQMDADTYLEVDAGFIPSGKLLPVDGTPFDFRKAHTLGEGFASNHPDIQSVGGYDHCFNFVGGETEKPVRRATLYDPKSGREMQVITNQPSIQLYTGNMMNDPHPFKGGFPQKVHNCLCLETQHMPDSINHPNFTNVVLEPGQRYDYTTEYAFTVR